MGLRRMLQRRKPAEDGPNTFDEMEEVAMNLFRLDTNATPEEVQERDDHIEQIITAALRADLGLSQDDPRGYEELVDEAKRRGLLD